MLPNSQFISCLQKPVFLFQWIFKARSTMWNKYWWENDGVDTASHERAKSLHLRPCFRACLYPFAQKGLLSTLPSLWAVQDSSSQCHPAITEKEVRQTQPDLPLFLCDNKSICIQVPNYSEVDKCWTSIYSLILILILFNISNSIYSNIAKNYMNPT